jgi:hypothetical protein
VKSSQKLSFRQVNPVIPSDIVEFSLVWWNEVYLLFFIPMKTLLTPPVSRVFSFRAGWTFAILGFCLEFDEIV